MKRLGFLAALLVLSLWRGDAMSDPAKYPQFAQQSLPKDVVPQFIKVDLLSSDVARGKKPFIVDVRSAEEYQEAHIKGAVSIPLNDFRDHLAEIPKSRPVVLY